MRGETRAGQTGCGRQNWRLAREATVSVSLSAALAVEGLRGENHPLPWESSLLLLVRKV